MKKITALAVSTILVAAASAAETSSFKSAPVIGLGLGYGIGNSKIDVPAAALGIARKNKSSISGFVGKVFGGYDQVIQNNFLVGLRISYAFDGSSGKHNTAAGQAKFKRSQEVAALAQFGLVMGNALPYLTAGWSISQYQSKIPNGVLGATALRKGKAWSNAAVFGAGIRVAIGQCYHVGFESLAHVNKKITVKSKNTPANQKAKLAPFHTQHMATVTFAL